MIAGAFILAVSDGGGGKSRTCDLAIIDRLLWPAELRHRKIRGVDRNERIRTLNIQPVVLALFRVELRSVKSLAAGSGFEPEFPASETGVLPFGRLRNKRFGAAGLEPALLRSSGANTVYKTAALPIKLCPVLMTNVRLRRLDSNQNLRLQRPASCRLNDTAKSWWRARESHPPVQAYETCEPLLLYARKNFSAKWPAVDSHHSLRLFKPMLELSQLPGQNLSGQRGVAGAGVEPARVGL